MIVLMHIFSVCAAELYNFNHVSDVQDRAPIKIIENEEGVFKFYNSSVPSHKVAIHQSFAFVVQKLSRIEEIKADGYLIRPFDSVWLAESQKCLARYKHSLREKGAYIQVYGDLKVRFLGGLGDIAVSTANNCMDVKGDMFLRIVDNLVNIDYSISRNTDEDVDGRLVEVCSGGGVGEPVQAEPF